MPSIEERDRILRESWINARFRVPDSLPAGDHFPIQVWGVIEDPMLAKEKPFQDVVSYWPAVKRWTVTHTSRADEDATDYPCNVTHWQPLPPLPWS